VPGVDVQQREPAADGLQRLPQRPGGQVFVFFIMLVAAAEVTVGLAILVMMKRNVDSVDMNQLNRLKW
jgi:NADH:ubiquinone oxidoreductase subunit K